jgi:hypothetical protein
MSYGIRTSCSPNMCLIEIGGLAKGCGSCLLVVQPFIVLSPRYRVASVPLLLVVHLKPLVDDNND